MPSDGFGPALTLRTSELLAFLLVMARLVGLFTFLPLPGARQLLGPAKLALAAVLAFALLPFWPRDLPAHPGAGAMLVWLAREAGLGVLMGVVLAFLGESVTLAAQLVATQAGYSYATSIDPNSEADSGVLAVIAQLFASLLFFALGLHRRVLAGLIATLEHLPPGGDWTLRASPEAIASLGAAMFQTALSLALPVVAILLILDLTLALLSRINQQLQLLSIAFPAKMLVGLGVFAVSIPAVVLVYESQAARILDELARMVGGSR
jgi:flagellar biosynthetic protein FliR